MNTLALCATSIRKDDFTTFPLVLPAEFGIWHSSAYIFLSRRFSSSSSFKRLIMAASILPYFARFMQNLLCLVYEKILLFTSIIF